MDKPIEPPQAYTIAFKTDGYPRIKYRISEQTIAQIVKDWQTGRPVGAYDVEETSDGSYRKLILRFEDVLYIG